MKIVRDLQSDLDCANPVVFCLGFFDGVHRGHQFLIAQARRLAENNGTIVLLSFRHAPQQVCSQKASRAICTTGHKEELLKTLGVDRLIHVPFTSEIKNLSAQDFLQLLQSKMNIQHYVVCEDVSFGCNRMGNLSYLVQEACSRGQTVHCFNKIEGVSSTQIRAAIQVADFDKASSMLARPYAVSGIFQPLAERGYYLDDSSLCLPPDGEYRVAISHDGSFETTTATIIDNRLHLYPNHLKNRILDVHFIS